MEIKENARNFSHAIKSTSEFHQLMQAKMTIEKNNSLKSQMLDFNKKLSTIYQSNNPQNVKKYQADQLHRQFSSLTQNEDVKKFSSCSKAFSQMIAQTNQYVTELLQNDIQLK